VVTLTSKTWALLNRVNRTVNRDIWPEEDERHYGRAEYWTIPSDGYGDCDDYAVTKRKALLDAGLPAPALRLAVVMTPKASRHAVLTVATDKGDLVLDNLSDEVLPWNAAGFTWVERQDAVDPMKWVSLQPVSIAAAQDRATAATK
jgi:predicted transglutaminase-like cysteine proteinase